VTLAAIEFVRHKHEGKPVRWLWLWATIVQAILCLAAAQDGAASSPGQLFHRAEPSRCLDHGALPLILQFDPDCSTGHGPPREPGSSVPHPKNRAWEDLRTLAR